MTIHIGIDTVSGRQEFYLKRAKGTSSLHVKADLIYRVISQSAVQSGREMLHPDWIEIYQSICNNPSQILIPESSLIKVHEIFGELSCDSEISTIDPKAMRLAFLLGAGASKPSPSDIPTVKELLPDLLYRARRLDRADVKRLADFCENSSIENIEDLLTAATLSGFCSRNPSILSLVGFLIFGREPDSDGHYISHKGLSADLSAVSFLQDTLQVLFGLLSSRMLPAKPNAAHDAIAEYIIEKPESSIVTTNYDCCVDLALSSKNARFSYHLDFANEKQSEGSESDMTPLIKLHGSLNWYYCETCQDVFLIDIEKTQKEYLDNQSCYSVIAVCRKCGGQRRGLLVPPLAMKFDMLPPLTPLIEKAQDFFNEADSIVVVGFSFADADMYLSRMLTKSMQNNKNLKIILFDPDFNIAEKLRDQLFLRISDFDKKRVIRVPGDCANTLPEFLKGKLKPAQASLDAYGIGEDAPLPEQMTDFEPCAKEL